MKATTMSYTVPRLAKHASDFCVKVAWSGIEDKPFYKALFCSASRANLVRGEPFWGYAVIGVAEFNRLVSVLEQFGCQWTMGGHQHTKDEYYVEVEIRRGRYCCGLGFDRNTLHMLGQMMEALGEPRQQPLKDVINRISRVLGQ
jgi:hypothetical protein